MFRWISRRMILSCMMLALPLLARAEQEPRAVVEGLQAGLIKVMKEGPKLGYQGRFAQLAPLVKETHQLRTSARIALGPHWAPLTEPQRTRFVDTFTTLSIATYAYNFNKYSDEQFKTESVQSQPRGKMLVRAVLTSPGQPDRHFDYVLEQAEGKWKIINIVVDGVSDLALKRSEYGGVIEKEGFDALLKKLNDKIENYKETAKK